MGFFYSYNYDFGSLLKANPKKVKQLTLHDYHVVDRFIEKKFKDGYICDQVDEGVLGSGSWAVYNPNGDPAYEIREVYLNNRSVAHTIEPVKKFSPDFMRMVEEYNASCVED